MSWTDNTVMYIKCMSRGVFVCLTTCEPCGVFICQLVCKVIVSMCPCVHVSNCPCVHVSMCPCVNVSMCDSPRRRKWKLSFLTTAPSVEERAARHRLTRWTPNDDRIPISGVVWCLSTFCRQHWNERQIEGWLALQYNSGLSISLWVSKCPARYLNIFMQILSRKLAPNALIFFL